MTTRSAILEAQGTIPAALRTNEFDTVNTLTRNVIYENGSKDTVNANQSFKIELPMDALLNGKNIKPRLRFNAVAAGTGGSYVRFRNDIRCVFRRIRVQVGHQTVHDIDSYPEVVIPMTHYRKRAQWQSNAGYLAGWGNTTLRNSLSSGFDYEVELDGLEVLNQLLPLYRKENRVILEFFTNDTARCIESDKSNLTLTLTDIQLIMDTIHLDDQQRIASVSRDIIIPFEAFKTQTATIGSGITSKTIKLNANFKDLEGIGLFFLNDANLTDPTANDALETMEQDALDTVVLKVDGNRIVHQNGIDIGKNQGYYDAQKFWGVRPEDDSPVGYANWDADDKFFVGIDMSTVYKHDHSKDVVGAGRPVSHNATLELTWSSSTPAQLQCYIIYKYKSMLHYQSNGTASWDE